MDLRSLNSGTVESKQWLNPVCGTIRANIVETEESKTRDEQTGTVFPNTSTMYVYYTPAPIASSISVPGVFLTDGRSASSVPASAFVPGAMFDYFYAGKFVDTTPANASSLILSLTFNEAAIPITIQETFCDAIVSSGQSTDTEQMFQVRVTFHVTAAGPTSITVHQTMLMLCNGTANANVINNSETKVVTTPSRVLSPIFSPRPFALAAGGPVTLTTFNWYLRRIA